MKLLKFSLLPILIASILILSGASESTENNLQPAQPPQPNTKVDSKKRADQDNRADTTHAITESGSSAIKADQSGYLAQYAAYCGQKANNENDKWSYYLACEKITDLALVTFSAALTFATVVLVMFAGWQAYETRKAANAAKDAAAAAKQQGIIMAALDRPWLIPDKPIITGWPFDPEPPHTIRIQWSVRNFGTSPAFLTKLSIKFGIERWPLPEPPKYDAALPFGDLAIPQNRDHATEKTFTLPENIVRDIEDGNGSVLVYGFLKYHDALGDEHATRFCCYWFYPGQIPRFSPVGPSSYMEYT
ncbi:MAG: hypothetical protein U1E51_06225 [Candidatus Binatia bacterium]|nr:hypothetical protein [Candidatus Binatia bacterium]